MPLTGANIRNALATVGAVGGQMKSYDELAAGANAALAKAPDGLTYQGAAAFLATLAQESDYFRVTEEYAKNGRYAPYIGRGFEMITWQANYSAFGTWCHSKGLLSDASAFVKSPKSLADYKWAWLSGVWFFQANGLWKYANSGNFLAVEQGVNGGNGTIGSRFVPAGYSARLKMYNSFLKLGKALLPGTADPDTAHADTGQDLNADSSVADIKALQKILGLTADGIAGPATIKALEVKAGYASIADGKLTKGNSAAIKKVQARMNETIDAGVTVDGAWGPKSAVAFHNYLAKGGKLKDLDKQSLTVKPAPKPTVTGTKFPLASGHFYGVNDNTVHSHSGVNKADQPAIKKIQKAAGVGADGLFGAATKAAVVKWQKAHKLSADGVVGPDTWKAMKL